MDSRQRGLLARRVPAFYYVVPDAPATYVPATLLLGRRSIDGLHGAASRKILGGE